MSDKRTCLVLETRRHISSLKLVDNDKAVIPAFIGNLFSGLKIVCNLNYL